MSETFISPSALPTGYENEILVILDEECAEVTQRSCKLKRFGRDEIQPGQPHTNAYRLGEEVGDLLYMIDLCVAEGLIDPAGILAGRTRKPTKMVKFLQHKKGLAASASPNG